jgi:hypothetical protein
MKVTVNRDGGFILSNLGFVENGLSYCMVVVQEEDE